MVCRARRSEARIQQMLWQVSYSDIIFINTVCVPLLLMLVLLIVLEIIKIMYSLALSLKHKFVVVFNYRYATHI